MSRPAFRIPACVRSSVSLVLAATMVVGAGAAETPKGNAVATGTLSVTTDPDKADVYVDGHLAGQTPGNLVGLSAGEHRVRIVKSGYLENARIVTLSAGAATQLNVKLTRTSGASNETAAGQVTSTGGGGGGSKKWLWIGLAGAGAVAVAVAARPHNDAPTAGTITVSPTGTGMAGQTSFTFTSAGASDPDGDSLTKSWTTSDGGSGTGDTFTRTFATAGTFQVNLKVSDGKLDASTPAASVTVGPNLTANWTGGTVLMPNTNGVVNLPCGLTFGINQSGTSLANSSLTFTGNCFGGAPFASATATVLTHPTTVNVSTGTITFNGFGGLVLSFSGATNAAGTTLTGNVTLTQASSNFTQTSSTSFTRQ
jgi:hypothetical protein